MKQRPDFMASAFARGIFGVIFLGHLCGFILVIVRRDREGLAFFAFDIPVILVMAGALFNIRVRVRDSVAISGVLLSGVKLRPGESVFLDAPVTVNSHPAGHMFVTSERFLFLPYWISMDGRIDVPLGDVRDVALEDGPRSALALTAPKLGVAVYTPKGRRHFSGLGAPAFMGGYNPAELYSDLTAALERAGWEPRPLGDEVLP